MSKKKRILFFIDWYYPAFKAGGPISSVRNLCLQLKNECEVLVVTSDRDLGDNKPIPNIPVNEITNVEGINVIYLSPDQISADRFHQIRLDFNPDVIHLNSLFSTNFTLLPLRVFKKDSAKIIISPRGMFGAASLKIKPLKKKLFFIYAKLTSLFKRIIWHATSDLEAKEIKSIFGNDIKIRIANNVPYLPEHKMTPPIKVPGNLSLLSVGRLAPIKNFDFLLETLKNVKSNISLNIVGPSEDEGYAENCLSLAKQLPSNITVDFLGGMAPVDIGTMYGTSHVFITASKNENFGHSIVEALGAGRPIIVSDQTPWHDLGAKGVGYDLPLDMEKFANKIEYFASLAQEEYNEYCNNARLLAVEVANPERILANYESLYNL